MQHNIELQCSHIVLEGGAPYATMWYLNQEHHVQYKLEHQCSHIVLLAGGPYSGLSRSTIHNHVVSELGAPYAEQNKASFGEVHCLRLTLSNHYMNTVKFQGKKPAHEKRHWCVNGNEKCFDLMCISEKVNESLLRYGNPDMHFLGTLKNRIHFPRFLTINMQNQVLLF